MQTATQKTSFSFDDWDDYARCYDSLSALTPYIEMIREVTQNTLSGDCTSILDASCGTGNFERSLYNEKVHQIPRVTGVDSSLAMLNRAKKKCEGYEGISFLETNLNATLPFEDETFSQVVCINTLYAVSSPEVTLAEFNRVLKKGGVLHLVTPKYGYENGLILKKHCKSTLPNIFWMNAHATLKREEMLIHEAIDDEDVARNMLTIAQHNRYIGMNTLFHFFKKEDLLDLLHQKSFSVIHSSLTYADQALFITATKS